MVSNGGMISNHSKSGVVTFGKTKSQHFESLKNREWLLGDTKVEELYEHKNLGVLRLRWLIFLEY